jgi:hypothetical protein
MAPARYSGGDGMRLRPDPVSAGMSGRSMLAGGAAAVAVFAGSFALGNALGEDERSAAPHAPAKQESAALGTLRLEPAPALPELRARPVRPGPRPAAAVPARPAPPEAAAPTADPEPVPAEAGGYAAPTPAPPVSSAPSHEPVPATPAPPSDPPPSPKDVQEQSAPGPDAAPAPAPAPTPDPSPKGGSGQYQGP